MQLLCKVCSALYVAYIVKQIMSVNNLLLCIPSLWLPVVHRVMHSLKCVGILMFASKYRVAIFFRHVTLNKETIIEVQVHQGIMPAVV